MSAVVGMPWSAVAFVSSQSRPGTAHPVELAQQTMIFDESAARLVLGLGPNIGASRGDGPLPDRFVIAEQ